MTVDGPEAALGIIEQLFADSSLSQKDTFGALVAILNAEISEADIQQVILISIGLIQSPSRMLNQDYGSESFHECSKNECVYYDLLSVYTMIY